MFRHLAVTLVLTLCLAVGAIADGVQRLDDVAVQGPGRRVCAD
jgi:hypothetical protein